MQNKFIVAIGASAGGHEPILTFFDRTPNDNATYFVITHLPADYKSQFQYILKRHSSLEVVEAEDNMLIEKNKIYTLPAHAYMTIKKGKVHLQPRHNITSNRNNAIDVFFNSLAVEKGKEAIAVILSGAGSDGTEGAHNIKQAGGMVIVQEPETCVFSHMPRSVIDVGVSDYQLSPGEMPDIILTHINRWLKTDKSNSL